MDQLIAIFIFCFGALIGSFLNVCIVRMPEEKSIVMPGSHCPSCKTPIAWFDNIPLVSYFVLGGKCRACKAKFSFRYVLVEFITAVSFLFLYSYYGLSDVLWPYLFMVGCFIVATFVDFAHRIIPDEISIGGMIAGLIFSFIFPALHHVTEPSGSWILLHLKSLGTSLIGLLVGGGIIYIMGMLGDFMLKKETMGGGDVKLMAMIGAFLGWKLAILTFFLAPFFGAVFGIIEKIRTKDSAIAYGPFLILAALISLLFGDRIIHWIMSGYGMY